MSHFVQCNRSVKTCWFKSFCRDNNKCRLFCSFAAGIIFNNFFLFQTLFHSLFVMIISFFFVLCVLLFLHSKVQLVVFMLCRFDIKACKSAHKNLFTLKSSNFHLQTYFSHPLFFANEKHVICMQNDYRHLLVPLSNDLTQTYFLMDNVTAIFSFFSFCILPCRLISVFAICSFRLRKLQTIRIRWFFYLYSQCNRIQLTPTSWMLLKTHNHCTTNSAKVLSSIQCRFHTTCILRGIWLFHILAAIIY